MDKALLAQFHAVGKAADIIRIYGGTMTSQNLGTKRICPKCDAKFYDFGAVDPITCPKCANKWREGAKKKAKIEPKKETKPAKPVRKVVDDDLDADVDLPEIEDGDDSLALEPLDDDGVELTSLEEVEEHEEEDENDPNSDDADDEMFEIEGGEKLVDDLEDHLEEEYDEDEEDENEDDDEDEDDDDDRPKRRRR